MHHRSDYDFDVISGPSTPPPAGPAAFLPLPAPPRPPVAAAPAPSRPSEEAANGGEKG